MDLPPHIRPLRGPPATKPSVVPQRVSIARTVRWSLLSSCTAPARARPSVPQVDTSAVRCIGARSWLSSAPRSCSTSKGCSEREQLLTMCATLARVAFLASGRVEIDRYTTRGLDRGQPDNTTTRHQTPPAPAPKPPQTDAPNQPTHHPDYPPHPPPLPHPPHPPPLWQGKGSRAHARIRSDLTCPRVLMSSDFPTETSGCSPSPCRPSPAHHAL